MDMQDTGYALPARLDTAAAPGLAKALLERCGKPLRLDAAPVTTVGALGLQVLVSAQAQWRLDDLDFGISDPSDAFVDGCHGLGIDPSDLGCPNAE